MYRLGRVARATIQREKGGLYDLGSIWRNPKRVKKAKLVGKAEDIVESRGIGGKALELGVVSTGAAASAMIGDLARLLGANMNGYNNVTFEEALDEAGAIALIAGMEVAVADVAMRGIVLAYNAAKGVPLPDAFLGKLRGDVEEYRRSGRGIKMPDEEFSIEELQETVQRLTREILTDAPTQSRLKKAFYKIRQTLGGAGEPPPPPSPVEYRPTLGDATSSKFARSLEGALLKASETSSAAFQAYVKLVEGNEEMLAAVYDGIQMAARGGDFESWWPKGITADTLEKAFRKDG